MVDITQENRLIRTGGGDYIEGNQTKVSMGDVAGSTIVIGNGNTAVGDNQNGATVPELIRLVVEIRAALAQARLDHETHEVIDGKFREAEEALKKPAPKKIQLLPMLKAGAEALALAVTAGEVITKLPPMVEKAIAWAKIVLK